jgi:hypothetical protein
MTDSKVRMKASNTIADTYFGFCKPASQCEILMSWQGSNTVDNLLRTHEPKFMAPRPSQAVHVVMKNIFILLPQNFMILSIVV